LETNSRLYHWELIDPGEDALLLDHASLLVVDLRALLRRLPSPFFFSQWTFFSYLESLALLADIFIACSVPLLVLALPLPFK